MSNRKKVRFIINPVSGIGRQKILESLIPENIDYRKIEYHITYTEYAKHAHELAKEASGLNYDIVAIAGGDGSVNEAGSALLHSRTSLAIIPTGSGNGLARHLKIPLNLKKSIVLLNDFEIKKIDTGTVNEFRFMGVAGVGFDAYIAHVFDQFGKRGFSSYAKLVLREYKKYQPVEYSMIINNHEIHRKALMVTIANSSQFGNGAKMAPQTIIDDGKFTVVITSKFPIYSLPCILLKLMTGRIRPSRKIQMEEAETLAIKDFGGWLHLDGEPRFISNTDLIFGLDSKSLNVIVAKK